jgi:hypothetical protein
MQTFTSSRNTTLLVFWKTQKNRVPNAITEPANRWDNWTEELCYTAKFGGKIRFSLGTRLSP